MKNKKAWLRIVEALLGVLIIAGGVLYIASKQAGEIDISDEVYEKQRQILDVISNNENMRDETINLDLSEEGEEGKEAGPLVNDYISKNIPDTWDFIINVCDVEKICNQDSENNNGKKMPRENRDIYVNEIVISASPSNYPNKKSRKLMFFIWRK